MNDFPVSELQQRYQLGEYQSVINRYKHLGIKPFKKGRSSFITAEQLQQLDNLNEFLKTSGAKMSDYSPRTGSDGGELAVMDAAIEESREGEITITVSELSQLVRSVASAMQQPVEPLLHLKELEGAAAAGWLLTSAEVKALIGTKPSGDVFHRGSFSFARAGKIGNQISWRVLKKV